MKFHTGRESSGDPAPTLCFPDGEKSCFACCPPIRPAGYEHISYKNMIRRMLRENTRAFVSGSEAISPITGFSCWALGYLDRDCRLVGCLLHPVRNGGVDLRYRVNYWNKCRRENCPESKEFLTLGRDERRFWLHLAKGLDAFAYSSRAANPLFSLLGWGSGLLGLIASEEEGKIFDKASFFQVFPFFETDLNPKAHAYVAHRLTTTGGTDLLKSIAFRARFEIFTRELSARLRGAHAERGGATHTHLLNLDPLFLDFLRLSAGIRKIDRTGAEEIKKDVDEEITNFR